MCNPLNPLCLIQKGGSAAASAVTNSFLDELRKSCVDATVSLLKTLRMSRVPWNFGGGPLIVRPR